MEKRMNPLNHLFDFYIQIIYKLFVSNSTYIILITILAGFTDLTEKYTKTNLGGPSKLTETLNSYIGAMVQEILSHNGNVLKFSGDAFIVMWKLQDGMIMRDIAVAEAMLTACEIQKHFGTYNTERNAQSWKINLIIFSVVKLAIASGKTYFTSIDDPKTMSYYVITGKPVWDVKFAETLCRYYRLSFHNFTHSRSRQYANPNEYVHEKLADGIHTLIITYSAMWYHGKTHDIHNDVESDDEGYIEQARKGFLDLTSYDADALDTNLMNNDRKYHNFKQVDYILRPKVIKVAKAQLKDSLRSYMLRPVIRSVEMDEPLEHLTEMRQVVILFINVITKNISKHGLILLSRIVDEMHGCVNKTSLFDKDLIFLCIFGLQSDKHELESQIGLRCACRVRQYLLAMKNVTSVTIAVTTGMTYCGVVGHILRREYTVIGMSVNKAARLMIAYNSARN
ncbi:adenylate cyclase type 10-like [Linepithema humile]|uniref:adenylate cyclase type 10-like n=1 Tax=Linepithema humile TaxID=83485 RepID=UPI00351EDFE6